MGLLVKGSWQDKWYDTKVTKGQFLRESARFRSWISNEPGPDRLHPVASGRYHLYVSLACPWAHRTLIFRKLKGLEEHISVSVVSPDMLSEGWEFDDSNGLPDHLYGLKYAHEIYTRAESDYTGRVTVPVLWDKQHETIVNNESSEIIRMLNGCFNELTANQLDFYPAHLRPKIDEVNKWVYHCINNGVYKAGFATTQEAYDDAVSALFGALDRTETILRQQPFLAGDYLTEADLRLFTTLVRFDPVYVGHFKCNLRRIADYPAINHFLRQLYQIEGIADTVNLWHIKRHYYFSHRTINPTGIIPAGPDLNYDAPHNRGEVRIFQ